MIYFSNDSAIFGLKATFIAFILIKKKYRKNSP